MTSMEIVKVRYVAAKVSLGVGTRPQKLLRPLKSMKYNEIIRKHMKSMRISKIAYDAAWVTAYSNWWPAPVHSKTSTAPTRYQNLRPLKSLNSMRNHENQ